MRCQSVNSHGNRLQHPFRRFGCGYKAKGRRFKGAVAIISATDSVVSSWKAPDLFGRSKTNCRRETMKLGLSSNP
ncbi:hypothetical protein TNCV_1379911 [Trichonephila clavipes]|nr:hypothetical protein TNCV_1379911 [Trichonephila clavipes]